MAVLLEFTIAAGKFTLGDVLRRSGSVENVELERVIPLGEHAIPYLWISSPDYDRFEREVSSHPLIESAVQIERLNSQALYRIQWANEPDEHLIDGLRTTDASLLEAYGGSDWFFRVRFPDQALLAEFHTYCTTNEIPIHIERVFSLTERDDSGPLFDLSLEQREALLLAIDRGYFETPSGVTLEEIAAELEVSQQAVSDRIRRGVESVLVASLVEPATDDR